VTDEAHAIGAEPHVVVLEPGLGCHLEAPLVERRRGSARHQQLLAGVQDRATGLVAGMQSRVGIAQEDRARLVGDVAACESRHVDDDGVAGSERATR
jgi:hypothetical protein